LSAFPLSLSRVSQCPPPSGPMLALTRETSPCPLGLKPCTPAAARR
jgi:hypothetical protein